jgi:hypothetical protein
MPDNPLSGNGASFQGGMFLALTPIGDPTKLPEHDTDPNWPEVESAANAALSAFMADFARQRTWEAVALVFEKHKGNLKAQWCDAAEVSAAIRTAGKHYDLLQKHGGTLDPASKQITEWRQALAQALPKIKAGNKQIHLMLSNKVVLKLNSPKIEPAATFEPELLQKAQTALNDLDGDAKDAAAKLEPIKAQFAELKQKKSGAEKSKYDEKDISAVEKQHGALEDAIAKLPDLVGRLKKELAARVQTSKKEFAVVVKKARQKRDVEKAVVDAAGFQERMTNDQAKLLSELGFHELNEDEKAEAEKGRADVRKRREEYAARADSDIAKEEKHSRETQLGVEESQARANVAPADKDRQLQEVAERFRNQREALARVSENDLVVAARAREGQKFQEEEDALQEEKLKAQKVDRLKAVQDAVGKVSAAMKRLQPKPNHAGNDMAAVDEAVKALQRAIDGLKEPSVSEQFTRKIYEPLTRQVEEFRPEAKPARQPMLQEWMERLAGKAQAADFVAELTQMQQRKGAEGSGMVEVGTLTKIKTAFTEGNKPTTATEVVRQKAAEIESELKNVRDAELKALIEQHVLQPLRTKGQ